MAARGKKAGAPKKKANGYKMPPPIPLGEVIHDTLGKKKWRIGPSIGVGGFGEIYVACDDDSPPKKGANYPYVVKIEPHENGPLFVEKHFYVRNANKDDIQNFMKSRKLSSLGMPGFHGSGSHEFRGEKFRYLVLERYGTDIWKIFNEAGRVFPPSTVFQLGLQMLDVIEYIHSRGYLHADLKGSNILLGIKKGTENQAYLLDFGLAQRVTEKEFKPDPKCAHNGTIEYTSRDAHLGVATMRGDLEILGYNLLQWLVGELPWEKVLTNQKKVQEMKEDLLKDVRATITKKYPKVPDALIKFFEYINTLKPKEQPDYTKCRQIFESYLKSVGKTRYSKLEFTATKARKGKLADHDSDDDKPLKQNGDTPKAKRGRKAKAKAVKSDSENETSDTDDLPLKRSRNIPSKVSPRKPKPKPLESDSENEPINNPVKKVKRKSLEPALVVKVKRAKLTPRVTPPAKKNHINTATQTSEPKQTRQNTKQVTIVSPSNTPQLLNSVISNSINSSGDIFEDSFEIQKVKPKRRLLAKEEVIQTRVVKKKVTTVKKGKSWKDTSAIVNGKSPPI